MKKNIAVSEDDLRKYYAENEKRYTAPEERRASHILVKADKDAPKAERDKARAKAEALLAEVRKNPQAFAEIAKKNSDDEGSAAKGGDLDFFGRGAMVKPFEDAAFALKPGEISGIVESDFGFHIIQVTGARGGEKKSFESVRAAIESEVSNQLAQKKFADAAVEFGDTVYEQPDSLKPAADKWKLEIKTAQHVTRTPGAGRDRPARQSALPRGALQQRRDARQAQHQGDRRRRQPARRRPRRPVRAGAPAAVRRSEGQGAPAARRDAGGRAGGQARRRAAGEGARRAERGARGPRRSSSRAPSRATCRDRCSTRSSRRRWRRCRRSSACRSATRATRSRRSSRRRAAIPVVGDPAKAMAQYAQVWADAEAQAYYAALKIALQGERQRVGDRAARARAQRAGAVRTARSL